MSTFSPQECLPVLFTSTREFPRAGWSETGQSGNAGQQIRINEAVTCDQYVLQFPWRHFFSLLTFTVICSYFPWVFVIFPSGWNWKAGVRRPLRRQRGLCRCCAAIFQEHQRPFECCTSPRALYSHEQTSAVQWVNPVHKHWWVFSFYRTASLTPPTSLRTVSTSASGDTLTWLKLCGITWWVWQDEQPEGSSVVRGGNGFSHVSVSWID